MPDFFTYPVTRIQSLTDQVSQIVLSIGDQPSLAYQAGQYIEVIHQNQTISPLSIASAPNQQGVLEFHLFHPEENGKAWELLRMAKENQVWQLRGPYGICTAERLQKEKPILFLARGTGFAPIKAVIEALMVESVCPSLHLYWSVRKQEDVYLKAQWQQWLQPLGPLTFTPVYTAGMSSEWPIEVMLKDYPDLSNHQVYASGPRPLIQAAFSAFEKQGLQKTCFYSDVL